MTTIRPRLIVVVGPTGSGKTDLAINLATHFGCEILSTDSRQIYKGMAIGTAQPTAEQLSKVRHHFIAELDVRQDFTCGMFEKQALGLLDTLFADNRYAVAVGGSGLYVNALCNGLDDLPVRDDSVRQQLQHILDDRGLAPLLEMLRERDPAYYDTVDRCNPARVLRALEVCITSSKPYSEQRTHSIAQRPFEIIKIGTELPRATLYARIDARVDAMLDQGLEAEAESLYPLRECNSLQTVGYRELFEMMDGKITREQAVELIKRNSRRYAKRQITWFSRDNAIKWFAPSDTVGVIDHIESVK